MSVQPDLLQAQSSVFHSLPDENSRPVASVTGFDLENDVLAATTV